MHLFYEDEIKRATERKKWRWKSSTDCINIETRFNTACSQSWYRGAEVPIHWVRIGVACIWFQTIISTNCDWQIVIKSIWNNGWSNITKNVSFRENVGPSSIREALYMEHLSFEEYWRSHWIPLSKGQYCGQRFHVMTSSFRASYHGCWCQWLMKLIHWVRDKMPDISQTTWSNAFSWMKLYEFRFIFHWLFSKGPINNISALF